MQLLHHKLLMLLNYRIKGSPPWTPTNTEAQHQAEEPQLTPVRAKGAPFLAPPRPLVSGWHLRRVNRRGSPGVLTDQGYYCLQGGATHHGVPRKSLLGLCKTYYGISRGRIKGREMEASRHPTRWKVWVKRVKKAEKGPDTCKQHLPGHALHLITSPSCLLIKFLF